MKALRAHWQLIALTALVFTLWTTPVILPLKILIVFLHEVSHGLAALLTGGSIESISLSPQQGGLWLVISLTVIAGCLRYGLGRQSNIGFGRKTDSY